MNDFVQGPVSQRAQGLSIFGSLLLLLLIMFLVKKGYLKSGYSILWFFIASIIFVMSLFTDILIQFSRLTGIYYAPAAIFTILIAGIILITIHYSTILSRHERRIKKLTQEIALLKDKLKLKK